MSKKSFKGGFEGLLSGETSQKKENSISPKKSEDIEIRATFIVDKEKHTKLKHIALWNRIKIKEALDSALESYILEHEEKNGPISIPKN